MIRSESLLAARTGSGSIDDTGVFVDPDAYGNASATSSTLWADDVDTTLSAAAVGLPAGCKTQTFDAVVGAQSDPCGSRVIARIPWAVTTASAGAATGRVKATLSIGGVSQGARVGATRALNAQAAFSEVLAWDIGERTYVPGERISIALVPDVVVAVAGNTFSAALNHDPADLSRQLVLEVQGVGGLT